MSPSLSSAITTVNQCRSAIRSRMGPEECLEQAFPSLVGDGGRFVGGIDRGRSRPARSFLLTAFSDVVQCLLLLSGAASFVPLMLRSRGRIRLFWSLIALGIFFWLSYQLLWTYYEVVLRRDVPVIFAGDVIIFLHIVPLMAAVALRPHVPRDEYSARMGRLDFALLLMWWFYLYVLIVIPWQYVMADAAAYNGHLNALYVTEEIAFLLGLAACWLTSKGHWRNLYASLLGMSICYAASSTVANWAIGREVYYSGSLYDIPLVAAMACLTWIGLRTKAEQSTSDAREASTLYGVWIARCSMIAVFSLPLFAAWSLSDGAVSSPMRVFRLSLTLIAAFLMGVMVLVRQHLLDRELTQLLQHSRESVDSLKHLQAQVLQSEKLASIGQLAGARPTNSTIQSPPCSVIPTCCSARRSRRSSGHLRQRSGSMFAVRSRWSPV